MIQISTQHPSPTTKAVSETAHTQCFIVFVGGEAFGLPVEQRPGRSSGSKP